MTNTENIKQNEVVFNEGVLSNTINVLLSGSVSVYINVSEKGVLKSYKLFSIPKNILLGIESSIHCSNYNFTFKTDTDITISKTTIEDEETVRKFFNANKNYITYMIRSLSLQAIKITDALHDIDSLYKDIATHLNNLSLLFLAIKDDNDYVSKNETINKMKDVYLDAKKVGIKIPNEYDLNFIKNHDDAIFSDIYTVDLDDDFAEDYKINFYKRLFKIPADIQDNFFMHDSEFSLIFAHDISKYILNASKTLKSYFNVCNIMINEIIGNENSIFSEYISIAEKMKENNWDDSDVISTSNLILEYISYLTGHYKNVYKNNVDINIDSMKKIIEKNICIIVEEKKGDDVHTLDIISGVENMPKELDKSAKKLVEASGIDDEKAKHLLDSLAQFKKIKDKLSSEDEARLIRRAINSIFFDVYSGIAKKVIVENSKDRLYQMFLDYSFFDEELLSKKNIIDLYSFKDNTSIKNKEIRVYTQTELLRKVYNKEELPSINGFGQSYDEHLRERMKKGEFNEEGYNSMYENANERFKYEIHGLISSTQKLCYGTISSYSAILHEDMIMKDINRSFTNKEAIEKAITDILKIDFGAFYREVLYKNPDARIDKEIILEEVYPEFILSPTYGSRSIMWQELNGRNKRSRGRIVIPVLTYEDISQMLISSIGAFRWELCKSVLGYSWNDLSSQSLTSEYYDYVTFYKRNKDLGEEAREKFIAQVKKARNNMRDIFATDYFAWLKYESQSIIRLNKVARGIMYRNVPFAKEIRETIGKQPIFSEIAYKFEGLRKKRAQELENRYARYKSGGGSLPYELQRHIDFYKNM